MAKVKDNYVFKLKGGEASTLECVDPFLERREPIVVFFENGQTNIKIGDGKNNYNNLPFISDTNVDISDVQGLTEILSQYEIDLENLNSKIDKIVIDKVYDPNSDNAQSGKAVAEAISDKVDKVEGKGLSTNDFTDEEKEKLANLSEGSGVYVGSGEMPEGYNVQIDPNGEVLSVDRTFDPTSENPQSGKAVAEAVSKSIGDINKVLESIV